MNFNQYCQEKGAPPGSSDYYAIRQAHARQQGALTALYAYRRELQQASQGPQDPTVAGARLAWWYKETLAWCDGGPSPSSSPALSHPVTLALARHVPALATTLREPLLALIEGYELDLAQNRYPDFAGLQRHLRQVGGTFAVLIARLTEPDAPWADALGQALALARILADLGNDARHGRIYLPDDEMRRYGVTAGQLMQRTYGDAYLELMRFQCARARNALRAALGDMPPRPRRTQAVLCAQAALAQALLNEIEAQRFEVLHQRIALTPLRKLWIAWRAARRA